MSAPTAKTGEPDGKRAVCVVCRAEFVFDLFCEVVCQNCTYPGQGIDHNREAIEAELHRERTRRSLKRG